MNTPLGIRIAIWTWFFAALAAGQLSLWRQIPLVALPGALFVLTALLLLAHRLNLTFRGWVEGTPLRTLVMLHATRFVGFYFLVLYQRGELPVRLALPGTLGCFIALLAVIIAVAPLSEDRRRRAISIWNVAGVADVFLVVASATRLGWFAPGEAQPLTHLPLSLLPTFLFPLILGSHIAIFGRLSRPAG